MKSLQKTRLAVARNIAGISQKNLAKLCDISFDHLRHLEAGDREMSPLFAGLFESRLGVIGFWLLGAYSDNPIDIDGKPYTLSTYRHFQGSKRPASIAEWETWFHEEMRETLKSLDSVSQDRVAKEMTVAMKKIFESVKIPPAPPSPENVPAEGARKPSSPKRRRPA